MARRTAVSPSPENVGVGFDVNKPEGEFGESVLATAELLARQPKRRIRVPNREGVKQRFVMVSVNGHTFQIARGQEVEVPQTVYDILAQAGEI